MSAQCGSVGWANMDKAAGRHAGSHDQEVNMETFWVRNSLNRCHLCSQVPSTAVVQNRATQLARTPTHNCLTAVQRTGLSLWAESRKPGQTLIFLKDLMSECSLYHAECHNWTCDWSHRLPHILSASSVLSGSVNRMFRLWLAHTLGWHIGVVSSAGWRLTQRNATEIPGTAARGSALCAPVLFLQLSFPLVVLFWSVR